MIESFLGLILVLIVIGGVLFLVLRPRGDANGMGKDTYFYVISFMLLLVLYWAVTDLFRIMFQQLMGSTSTSYSYYRSTYAQQNLLRDISLRLSTIVVAFPIWAFHWYKASVKPKAEIDIHSRKSYAFSVMVLMSLGVVGSVTWLVYLGFNALLGVSDNIKDVLPVILPYAVSGTALWVSHYMVWKGSKESLPNLPVKESLPVMETTELK